MFEQLFDKARQKMTTDKACEDCGLTKDTKVRLSQIKDLGYTEDAKMQIGAISHRKDGDYRKVAEGKFVPVKMAGNKGGESAEKPLETLLQIDKWLREDPTKLSDKELMEKNETLHDLAKNTKGENFKKLMNAGIGLESELAKRKLPTNPQGIGYKEAKEKSLLKPAEKAPGSPTKTFSFSKAGHVYQVPASSPEEAVALLKSRGVKGFKPSDAFDESTPRTKATENKPTNEKELRKSVENGKSTIPSSETSHLEKVKSANDFFDMMKKGGNTESKPTSTVSNVNPSYEDIRKVINTKMPGDYDIALMDEMKEGKSYKEAVNQIKNDLKKYGDEEDAKEFESYLGQFEQRLHEQEGKNKEKKADKKPQLPKSVDTGILGAPSLGVGGIRKTDNGKTLVNFEHPEFGFEVELKGEPTEENIKKAARDYLDKNSYEIKRRYPSAFHY